MPCWKAGLADVLYRDCRISRVQQELENVGGMKMPELKKFARVLMTAQLNLEAQQGKEFKMLSVKQAQPGVCPAHPSRLVTPWDGCGSHHWLLDATAN